MRLYLAASVQRVSIGPRGTMHHQSIFRERGRARALSAASPRLLKCLAAACPPDERISPNVIFCGRVRGAGAISRVRNVGNAKESVRGPHPL